MGAETHPHAQPPDFPSGHLYLNVAATYTGTRALGPGKRSAVWVQGCPFSCPDCIAPEWIPIRPARQVTPADLLVELFADPHVAGLTFSGGEPMLQASGLAELARLARLEREVDIICFTGYTLSQLQKSPPNQGVRQLLAEVDVLIDGQYVTALNDNLGLRGSSNQRVHHLTQRLSGHDFESEPRRVEIQVQDGSLWFVGIPPVGLLPDVLAHLDRFEGDLLNGGAVDERA